MNETQTIRQPASRRQEQAEVLPDNTHVAYSANAACLNKALLQGFLEHQHDSSVRRTHLFNGRYENIYLDVDRIPQIRELLDEACGHAGRILGTDRLQAGCWFNYMPPAAVTTLHSHDDDDELLSAVYYVEVPEDSGVLLIHQHGRRHAISPQAGKFVFFAPDVPHEVSENRSSRARLSIGINFGRRRDAND